MNYINPNRIQLALDSPAYDRLDPNAPKRISPLLERGKVVAGDWDRDAISFEEMDVWKAFKAHFIDNRPWKDTAFYNRVVSTLRGGIPLWGCKNEPAFKLRLNGIDKLFQEIKAKGFRSQTEIADVNLDPLAVEDEINVHINRHGDFIFGNGRHRLCIAKLLGINKVPVKIARRHSSWVTFRKDILTYVARHTGALLYHPITHPDLEDIPCIDGRHRMELMVENLPVKSGTVLDIGSHWGYLCHRFEENGFRCTAIEDSPLNLAFLKRLRRAENRRFDVFEGSLFEFGHRQDYDIILALNVFHHFLKEKYLFEKLVIWLDNLRTKVIFFEDHSRNEPQFQATYCKFGPSEFAEFVKENAKMNTLRVIGEAEDNHKMYIMTM